jgi:hypothetical protein
MDKNTHIEIQGYCMVNDGDGARLSKRQEKPDFFDISVLLYNDDTGEIEPVEEIENILDGEKAETILVGLVAKLPDAIDCGWIGWA